MKKISFIGSGKFGSAVAYALDQKHEHEISFFCVDEKVSDAINKYNFNSECFSDKNFSDKVSATTNFAESVKDADYIFISTPSSSVTETIDKLSLLNIDSTIIICSKGILNEEPYFFSEYAEQKLPKAKITCFYGPNFAKDIIDLSPTITNIACKDIKIAKEVCYLFTNTIIEAYPMDDIVGMQIVASMKNIMAIAVGISIGKEESFNQTIKILMELINETQDIVSLFDCDEKTMLLPCGIGDIMLTCFGENSRNRKFGYDIGSSKSIDERELVEGCNALKTFHKMLDKLNILNKCKTFVTIYNCVILNQDENGE